MPVPNRIRQAAAAAQKNEEQNGNSALSAYMRRASLGSGAPYIPRNKGEAIGLILGRLLRQGADEWKANYDLRGDFKREGEEYLRMKLRGEKLNPQQEALLADYNAKYSDEYKAKEDAIRAQLGNAPQQAVPNGEGILGAINQPQNTPQPDTLPSVDSPFGTIQVGALGDNIPNMQEALLNKFKQDELDRLLNGGNRNFF